MKTGKITAKLRDAVRVCFMVEGEEVKRYKNIEMPDALKELVIRDFGFNVLTDGKIEFCLHFDQGILPEEWPESRERKTRTAKAGEAVMTEAVEAPTMPKTDSEPMEAVKSEAPEAEPVGAFDAAVLATEPVTMDVTAMPEANMSSVEPTEAAKAADMPAPEKKLAKRGRKPESRFNKAHTEDVVM